MRALTITELRRSPAVAERPEPRPGDGQVLLEVAAAPLNPVDIWVANGDFFQGHPELPYVPGVEVVGRVREGGGLEAGTLVWTSLDGLGTSRDGCAAELVVARRQALVPMGDDVDLPLAAALGTAGLAAWIPLTRRAPVREGETVLVLGATGTVGQVAVQVARLLGAGRIVAAGRSFEGLAHARELGADETVAIGNAATLADDLRAACGPDGATLVFDPLWGEAFVAALSAAVPHARIIQLGQSGGALAPVPSALVRGKNVDLLGYTNFNMPLDVLADGYRELLGHAAAGRIRLDVDRVSLDNAPEAWRKLVDGRRGKVVVCP
jgi:NADPH:quinone reductase-like Zn-dependent oxidoreductase